MRAQGVIIGHHGCPKALARRILFEDELLRPGTHSWDWLGTGIYFWEASLERALDWNPSYRATARENWCALGAVVNLGNCLDLFDRECIADVQKAYSHVADIFRDAGMELPRNLAGGPGDRQFSKRLLDCLVIDHLHELNREQGKPEYDTVRCGFSEGAELYPGAMLFSQTHIQICVRNPHCILGYFKPIGVVL